MKTLDFVFHWITPRSSNNHHARALHLSAISFYITILLVFQVALTIVAGLRPGVLGYASNVNINDLLNDTNSKRVAAGAGRLLLNDQLSAAAAGKARDMFENQYWAHNSPQGKDPWSFIVGAGYNYLFAGENLARDFGDSQAIVDAWMNSSSHRDNLLNNRYKDVGFAVVNGKYGNNETTLVVQMFGAKPGEAPSVGQAETTEKNVVLKQEVIPTVPEMKPGTPAGMILKTEPREPETLTLGIATPRIDLLGVTRGVSSTLVLFLMGVLVVDGILVYRRKTVRLSGHNLAHLLILVTLLMALNLIGRGVIL